MEGSFGGEDANADGVISLDELGSLRAGSFMFHPNWSGELNGGSTSSFNYVVDGALSLHAYAAVYRVQIELETGVGYMVSGPVPEDGLYAWTPESQVLVSAVVPEPATAVLLSLGPLALGRCGINRRAADPR